MQNSAWDTFVRKHPRGHFLQLSAWGVLKSEYGWEAKQVTLESPSGEILAGAQILFRMLPIGKLAYIPFGPLVDWADAELVKRLFAKIHEAVRGTAFLKVEPGFDVSSDAMQTLDFRPSPQTVQPPRTVLIDLDNEEAILKRMNQGTRRNIRKAEKFEVEIREGTRADVDSFNAMTNETGQRDGFGVHVPRYYERVYDLFVPSGDAVLLLASYGGVDLAAILVFKVGQQAWYQYGASRDVERQRMASFGIQWAGIQWALRQGCTSYDMVGIPDEDEATLENQFESRNDGLWGVYRFKRGWGGRIVRTVGTWDYPYRSLVYRAYQLALRLRGRPADE
jgi:peptidoglycan pentaglycine glycine transferase (the first glycine)